MNSYHFSLGNSSCGPVGFCARITANSEEEALGRLRDLLPESVECLAGTDGLGANEYIEAYFNASVIELEDIDEADEANDTEAQSDGFAEEGGDMPEEGMPDLTSVEALLTLASEHGEDEGLDTEVGDLQEFLRAAFSLLEPWQVRAFARNTEVIGTAKAAARSM